MGFFFSCLSFVLILRFCNTQSHSSYFSVLKFHRLEATVIKVHTEESDMSCFMQCNRLVPECKSINMAAKPDQDGTYECILLSERVPKDKYGPLKRSDSYHHYTRLMPCEVAEKVCQNGGTCINHSNHIDYTCQCVKGYYGRNCETYGFRLVGSSKKHEGRLEVYHSGTWGTVCNDFWNTNAATVACRQLGFSGVQSYLTTAFGVGIDPIWLDNVVCTGQESKLLDCNHLTWGTHNCVHREDVGIICIP